ncbi:myosin-2-like isoform X2 [Coffea eugenioides]|uniref:myosin-2-like isoform X2 n=1 Tax=Coffea eugenioides TaxID=49369 RepID=UPI000F613E3C|nr:myosin-2-like isoform X2 [Coffea eugenioides]
MPATNTMVTPSSLELMLKQLQQMEDQPADEPPALPTRPVIRARLPRSRRQLSLSSQQSDLDITLSCEERMIGRRRAMSGDSFESAERADVGAPASVVESANGSLAGCGHRNHENGNADKVGNFDEAKEIALQWMLGKHLHGRQTCCQYDELKIGVITLQSFVRGENARICFIKKMKAIRAIQKCVKSQLRSTMLDEKDQAAIFLQASIRGWLAWRHYNSIDKRERQFNEEARNVKNLENKDQIMVPYSVLVDLQRRVLKTEALLDKKKEENATLKLQIKQLERKRQQYETKMKLMEKTWQDQLTSMQMSLAAKKSSSKHAVGKLGLLLALPEIQDEDAPDPSPTSRFQLNGRSNSDQLIDHEKGILDEDTGIFIHIEPGRMASSTNPEEELERLKFKFKTWKKDFKNKLMVAKTTIKKLGNSETGKNSHKKWWGR